MLNAVCFAFSNSSFVEAVFVSRSGSMSITIVFVEIDVPGYTSSNNTFYHETSQENGLPPSIKQGTISAVYSDVYGIVFPCSNSFVVTTRTNSISRPKEINYLMNGQKTMKNCGAYLPFPLIKMSEILAQPEEVYRQSERASRNIYQFYQKQAIDRVSDLQVLLTKTLQGLIELSNKTVEYQKSLADSVDTLQKYNSDYLRQIKIDFNNQTKPRAIHYNLYQREEMKVILLSELQKVNAYYDTIKSLERIVTQELPDSLEDTFCHVASVIPE